jgi:hypothetical protein
MGSEVDLFALAISGRPVFAILVGELESVITCHPTRAELSPAISGRVLESEPANDDLAELEKEKQRFVVELIFE